jgi:ubiquitin-conjugating enzyme E2 Q
MSRRSSSRLAGKGLKRKEAEAELEEEDRPKKKQKIEKKTKTNKKSKKNHKKEESEEESLSDHSEVPELHGSDEENSDEDESETPVAFHTPLFMPMQPNSFGKGTIQLRNRSLYASAYTPKSASKEGTESLFKSLTQIITAKGYKDEGFSVEPVDDNVYKWHVKLFGFDMNTQIGQDIFMYESAKPGRDHVLMEVLFPSTWPHSPPFMRVVYPRFHQYTGHITIGGSICVKELTTSGWNTEIPLTSLFIMVRNLLLEGGALIDMDSADYDYTEDEAFDAFNRVAMQHGWNP